MPSSTASNYSNRYIQCVISHLKLYKHACNRKVFLHKPFQIAQIYFYKAFINWTKLHTHVLRSTSSTFLIMKNFPFPSEHQILLIIQTCDVSILLCNSLFLPHEKKQRPSFSLRSVGQRGILEKKYSLRISLQSTTKLLPICSFVKRKTRLPEKLYVSTGVSLS